MIFDLFSGQPNFQIKNLKSQKNFFCCVADLAKCVKQIYHFIPPGLANIKQNQMSWPLFYWAAWLCNTHIRNRWGSFFRTQSSLIWLGWSNPIGICLLENWLRFLHWLGEDRPCTEMTFQPVRRMLAPLINARHLEEELCSRDTLLQLDFWIFCWEI